MTRMTTTVHSSFLPFSDADASLAVYRDHAGNKVRIRRREAS